VNSTGEEDAGHGHASTMIYLDDNLDISDAPRTLQQQLYS
jgi:hypothetical protein